MISGFLRLDTVVLVLMCGLCIPLLAPAVCQLRRFCAWALVNTKTDQLAEYDMLRKHRSHLANSCLNTDFFFFALAGSAATSFAASRSYLVSTIPFAVRGRLSDPISLPDEGGAAPKTAFTGAAFSPSQSMPRRISDSRCGQVASPHVLHAQPCLFDGCLDVCLNFPQSHPDHRTTDLTYNSKYHRIVPVRFRSTWARAGSCRALTTR